MDTFAQDEWELGGRAPLLKKHFDAIRTPTLVIDQPRGFIGHFSGWGWTAASARPSMDEGIRCQRLRLRFSPARDRSPSPKFTDERSLRASFDQP
jgi:hypothetical protein